MITGGQKLGCHFGFRGREGIRLEGKVWGLGCFLGPGVEAEAAGLGASRGGELRALSTWSSRFILPMWIMKPSVQAMSEGEWPPPTTFTRLFCCLARASTCQDDAGVSPAPAFLREAAGDLAGPAAGWAAQASHPPASKAPAWLEAAVQSTPGKGARMQGQEVSGMENQGIILRWGSHALSPLQLGALLWAHLIAFFPGTKPFKDTRVPSE